MDIRGPFTVICVKRKNICVVQQAIFFFEDDGFGWAKWHNRKSKR